MGHRDQSNISRNTWEKMNGYPSRFGTARRDRFGRLLPGEFNGQGRPMGGSDSGLSPAHDWSGFDSAFPNKPDGSSRNSAPREHENAGQASDYAAGWDQGSVAASVGNLGAGLPPLPGTAPQLAAGSAVSRGGGIATTRTTLDGQSETQDPKTGRMVSSGVANAPRATNFLPGDAGTNSLAEHRTVKMRPFDFRKAGSMADASSAANRGNFDQAVAWARNPTERQSTTSSDDWFETADVNGPRVQRLLDTAAGIKPAPELDKNIVSTTPLEAAGIGMKYGGDKISRGTGGRIQDNPTPGTVSYAGDGKGIPKNAAPMTPGQATFAANPYTPPVNTGAAGPKGPAGATGPASTIPAAANNDEWFGPSNNALGQTMDDVAKDKAASAAGASAQREQEQAGRAKRMAEQQQAQEAQREQLRKGKLPADPTLQVPDYAPGWY